MDALLNVTVLFAIALALSLLIERFLEILKALYDLIDSRRDWHAFWTQRTYKIKDRLEKKMRVFEYVDPKSAAPVLQRFSEMLLNTQGGYPGVVPVLSGDLVRTLAVKIGSKVVCMGIGVALAFWLSIDLVALWQQSGQNNPANPSSLEKLLSAKPVHFILSGIALGLGSGPVHKIITAIEKRREKQKQKGGRS